MATPALTEPTSPLRLEVRPPAFESYRMVCRPDVPRGNNILQQDIDVRSDGGVQPQ